MIIARKLKKENICEYLLYMWQIEDIIRACNFNIDVLNESIIKKYNIENEDEKRSVYEWYESLIEMMHLENVKEKGHLQLNKNIIIELNDFHAQMLSDGNNAAYNAKFFHILPSITQLRKKGEDGLTDIELCFNFQYGIMMLRMRKAEITPETLLAQTEISKFMVLLAQNFKKYKSGELTFED